MPKYARQFLLPEMTTPWMMNLSNKLLSELSLPGTHDSCCNMDCGILQCQTWSLTEQLKQGIRFFDIRCRHFEDRLEIHHDWVYCNLSFEDVLMICRNFLKAAPSECLVMRVKQEYTPAKCSRKFDVTFKEVYDKNKDILHLSERIPYLNEVRGKIWILFDFECNGLISFPWSKGRIQDMWCIDSAVEMKHKLQKIHCQILGTAKGTSDNLFLNFFSGTGHFGWPKRISKNTNRLLTRYKCKLGIVIFDFPGKDILNHVIMQNHFMTVEVKKVNHLQGLIKVNFFKLLKQKIRTSCSECNKKIVRNFLIENDFKYLNVR